MVTKGEISPQNTRPEHQEYVKGNNDKIEDVEEREYVVGSYLQDSTTAKLMASPLSWLATTVCILPQLHSLDLMDFERVLFLATLPLRKPPLFLLQLQV
jgi:hypothetical protein